MVVLGGVAVSYDRGTPVLRARAPPGGGGRRGAGGEEHDGCGAAKGGEREFFIANLLVRIHLIVEMILADWPCAIGVK